VIGAVLDGVAAQFSTPAKRAASIAGMTTAVMCARRRVPFLVAMVLSWVVAEGVERAYGAAADVAAIAAAVETGDGAGTVHEG